MIPIRIPLGQHSIWVEQEENVSIQHTMLGIYWNKNPVFRTSFSGRILNFTKFYLEAGKKIDTESFIKRKSGDTLGFSHQFINEL